MRKRQSAQRPWTLTEARRAVRLSDRTTRTKEEEDAQTHLLEALAYQEYADASNRRSIARCRKSARAKLLAEMEADSARRLAAAVARARRPTILSRRVTGEAIERSHGDTVPGPNTRRLAGVSAGSVYVTCERRRRRAVGGPVDRTKALTLRSSSGAILAHVVVAGAEHDLYAKLLHVLLNDDRVRRPQEG